MAGGDLRVTAVPVRQAIFVAPVEGESMAGQEAASRGANGNADDTFCVSAPQISLPKGGGAIRGIGEKFAANPVTGTGSLTVPIYASPGRSGFGPQLSLSYDSGAGNGPFGLGWSLALPSITRKTDKGLPRYDDADRSDIFILSGAEDLVPALVETNSAWKRVEEQRMLYGRRYRVHRYRPRVEGLFARIERWSSSDDRTDIFWRSISKDNIVTWYGKSAESRIADPADASRIFTWLICESHDDKGNVAAYRYAAENSDGVAVGSAHERNRTARTRSANRYLERIRYGNRIPYYPDLDAPAPVPQPSDWCFELVFDYGEHDKDAPLPDEPGKTWLCRDDPFSAYRATFEVRTYRLCRRALVFHHFPGEADVGENCLVRSTDFTYSQDVKPRDPGNPIFSFLVAACQTGYRRKGDGYLSKSLPPLEFEYTEPAIDETIHAADRASLENLPQGLDGTRYQWVDLDGEGLSGILSEQAGSWYYKHNVSPAGSPNEPGGQPPAARFAPMELVLRKPSLSGLGSGQQLLDLAGDGQLDLVRFDGPTPGFFERFERADWETFRPFAKLPALSWKDPNLKFIDLTGDGHADILISEDEVFTWHASLAETGFGPAHRVRKPLDEEKGPKLVFADGTESIFLADLSGDGLTDIARIRNGEVCYWPNLGYGRFGAKVTMDDAPWFEAPSLFDGRHIQLADIDGSGTTDIIYFSSRGTHLYFNQSGNGWSERRTLGRFPPVDPSSSAMAVDLLGNGTACLVWSSSLPGSAGRSLRYIDLMGGAKPHLLVKVVNNLGAETRIEYAPSTRFYVEDKLAGKPWITRLPFPVHVVARVDTYDYVSRNRFVTRHAYHHGYFDGVEREFRGFGMVEQWDTEEFAALSGSGDFPSAANIDAASHVPPVLTRTWFHTGIYLGRNRVSRHFAGLLDANDKGEYYREPGLSDRQARDLLLDDTVLPDGWSLDEEREACRALKGSMLRQETYALDGTAKAPHPYSVTEQNFTVERFQPQADNPYGVFFTHPRETITYHYERNPADPRVEHALTLEVDAFGNVLRSLAVGYGRRAPDANLAAADQQRQSTVLITYTKSDHTNAVEQPNAYRTPLSCDVRTYELTGYAPPGRFSFDEWIANDFARLRHMPEIPYEDVADGTRPQKRLIERVCTRYRSDDLAAVLMQGTMESLAIPAEAYKLAFTPGLLTKVFRRTIGSAPEENLLPDPAQVLSGSGGDQGGYVDLFGDEHWWIPSGRTFFDANADAADPAATAPQELPQARRHFFQPQKFIDPFGSAMLVQYDAENLFPVQETDPLGNTTKVELDYRVLQARLVTDPNGNRTEAAFDALGLVVGTAVQGKTTENLGDRLSEFEADLTAGQIDAFLLAADPRAQAQGLLADATTRMLYDPDRFRRTRAANPTDPLQWQPAVTATLARETHVSDLPTGLKSRIQIRMSYSDGFGREIQKKMQAEPGALRTGGPIVAPRWVGSGWIVFNNKGKPVRKYEPFFSASHDFEFARAEGVSPITFYDAPGRVVATLHPDHSWEKVVLGPWRQEIWDASDTVLTVDPKTDLDVADFFRRLPDADYLPGWYAARHGGALGPQAQAAAAKAAVHAATPTVAHVDPRGRTVLTVAHNTWQASDMTSPAAPEFHATRTAYDIEGNQRAVIDALGRVVVRYHYLIAGPEKAETPGKPIRQASMDGGDRWTLPDVTGKPIRAWDMRGQAFRSAYDALRRPTEAYVRQGNGPELLAGRTVYGESRPSPENDNLRGKVYQVFDQAGVVTSGLYDFGGNLLRAERRLAAEYKAMLDWASVVSLEHAAYVTRTRYDALNRPTESTSPDNSTFRPGYNEANLLGRLDVSLRGVGAATSFVTNIEYDAKGQRTLIVYGNGATTEFAYDPETFRLARLKTTRTGFAPADRVVQELSYTYDAVGNITHIRDDAQQTVFFRNKRVEPSAEYTYDAVHRLVEAFGREHLGQTGGVLNAATAPGPFDQFRTGLLHPGDGDAMGRYVERYAYDVLGNILVVRHHTADPLQPDWTRTCGYHEASLLETAKTNNRLSSSMVGSGPIETYAYDVHGNVTAMPHLPLMKWDFHDQLQATARQVVTSGTPETTWYVYDATGQRVRKVTERQALAGHAPTRLRERIYLPGFEIYREYAGDGSTVTLERETLHVADDNRRVALVETRTQGVDTALPLLTRYQFVNHLGSATLELDELARIISYEEYFPFGSSSYQAQRSSTETAKRYRYMSKEHDEESALAYHNARYYAAWTLRFASVDPLADKYRSQSPYVFAGNNPTTWAEIAGRGPGDPKEEAISRINELSKDLPSSKAFVNVSPETFVKQLQSRIEHPEELKQGVGTNFCWAAACMSYVYEHDPKGMVDAMFNLYTTGTFKYSSASGTVSISPAEHVRNAVGSSTSTLDEHEGLSGKVVDQMLFMTLAAGFKGENSPSGLNIEQGAMHGAPAVIPNPDLEPGTKLAGTEGYMNFDTHYDPGNEGASTWSGANLTKAHELWKAFGYNGEMFGSDIGHFLSNAGINKLFEELANHHEVILFINNPIFKGEDKPWNRFSGTHFIRVTGIKAEGEDMSIHFWDYGGWKDKKLSYTRMADALRGLITIPTK
jgi:RHS repeat-associated protein